MALAARGPRLLEEVKANGTREAFDDRGRAFDELGVDITHLVILVPDGSGRGGWRRCRADDSDLCRRVVRRGSDRVYDRWGRARQFCPGKPVLIDRRHASPGTVQKAPDTGSVH